MDFTVDAPLVVFGAELRHFAAPFQSQMDQSVRAIPAMAKPPSIAIV
jgi:hypothetical protein